MIDFDERAKVEQRLDELYRLGANWGGEGEKRPDVAAIDAARRKALTRPYPSRIIPTPDGGVLLDWEDESSYVEIEYLDASRTEWMWTDLHGNFKHGETQ